MSNTFTQITKTVYQTSDGVIHAEYQDAVMAQCRLNVDMWVAVHGSHGTVESDDIVENWNELKDAMNPAMSNPKLVSDPLPPLGIDS
jgi:hypothetical protein